MHQTNKARMQLLHPLDIPSDHESDIYEKSKASFHDIKSIVSASESSRSFDSVAASAGALGWLLATVVDCMMSKEFIFQL